MPKSTDVSALFNADGECVYFSPRVLPSHEDNPALYVNKVPVFKWNKDRTELVKVGERDVDKEIQDASIGITPYDLIDRIQRLGDDSPLHAKEGFGGDFTDFPETLGEACDKARDLDKFEDDLIKKKEAQNVQQSKDTGKPLDGDSHGGGGGSGVSSKDDKAPVPGALGKTGSQEKTEGKEKEGK